MAEEFEKPDTSHLKLKPKEIVRTDPIARPDDPNAISVEAIHRQNWEADLARLDGPGLKNPAPEPVPAGFKPPEITPVSPVAKPGDPEAIAVADILRATVQAQRESGYAELLPKPKRKSGRTRDFFLTVGAFDFVLGCVMLLNRGNVVVFLFGLSGIVLITSIFGYIMFFVMDDY